jgi:hypothetical protein
MSEELQDCRRQLSIDILIQFVLLFLVVASGQMRVCCRCGFSHDYQCIVHSVAFAMRKQT